MKKLALRNAEAALKSHQQKVCIFFPPFLCGCVVNCLKVEKSFEVLFGGFQTKCHYAFDFESCEQSVHY